MKCIIIHFVKKKGGIQDAFKKLEFQNVNIGYLQVIRSWVIFLSFSLYFSMFMVSYHKHVYNF